MAARLNPDQLLLPGPSTPVDDHNEGRDLRVKFHQVLHVNLLEEVGSGPPGQELGQP